MKCLEDSSLKDTVSGKLIPTGNYLCISVGDNGCGMSADTIKRIFEPFFTTKKIGRGTGLGLTAVYECIKSHDGYITVDSVENVGSTFCMFFPNPQETAGTDANGTRKAPPDESANLSIISGLRINRKKIMVIDDEAITRDALTDWLSGSNYKVICFSSGEEAIERFKVESEQISCVLLDMMLPGLSGADVFEHLKTIDPDVRVIIMTGYCKEEDLDLLMKNGVITVLSKPFNHSKLMDVIETVSNYGASVIKN
jgi:CheY-like chemotaxis protein